MRTSIASCAALGTTYAQYDDIPGNLTQFMIVAMTETQLPKINCIYHCSVS